MSESTLQKQFSGPRNVPRYVSVLALLGIIVLFACIRMRLRNMPLERDEGEYAYAGQLMLQGIPPYKLAYNMKLPGTYAAYAVIMVAFGETPAGVHEGLLIINVLTILLFYFLSRRLFDELAALVAAASYAIFSISPSVLGFAGHATHFVVLFALAGLLLLLQAVESQKGSLLFASGFLLGVSFVMKQPGIAFAIFGGVFLLLFEFRRPAQWGMIVKKISWYVTGAILPFLLTCAAMWWAGVFPKFWYWTFSYARDYGTSTSFFDGWQLFVAAIHKILPVSLFLWILTAIGLTTFWWNTKVRAQNKFIVGFLVFSFIAICPGLYFRVHYFILFLPVASLLIGLAISAAVERLSAANAGQQWKAIPLVVFLVAFGFTLYHQRSFFFRLDPLQACRSVYGNNPFPEAVDAANFIRNNSMDRDRVAILGSEPEIYFYSHRLSATGYIYAYPLLEAQPYSSPMQNEMMAEIEASKPEFLVYVNQRNSWLPQPGADMGIFSWAQQYVHENYQTVQTIPVGVNAGNIAGNIRSAENIVIFRRKAAQ